MRLKEMDAGADLIEIPEDEILFQKSYYTIGTVAEMFKSEPIADTPVGK